MRDECRRTSLQVQGTLENLLRTATVECSRSSLVEAQASRKFDLVLTCVADWRRSGKKLDKPRLILVGVFWLLLCELKSWWLSWNQALVQQSLQTERKKIAVLWLDDRDGDRVAIVGGKIEQIGGQELENVEARSLLVTAAEPHILVKRLFVSRLVLRNQVPECG